jgi:hypothetical protein
MMLDEFLERIRADLAESEAEEWRLQRHIADCRRRIDAVESMFRRAYPLTRWFLANRERFQPRFAGSD